MTVRELIKLLEAQDPEAVPVIIDDEHGDYFEVEAVQTRKWDYRVDKSVPWVEIV